MISSPSSSLFAMFFVLVAIALSHFVVSGSACITDFEDRFSSGLETVHLVCRCPELLGYISLDRRPLHDGDFDCTVHREADLDSAGGEVTILDCGSYVSGEYGCHCPSGRCQSRSIVKAP
ncbi:hypothetical protein BV898_00220 [Hypsibius exemplaris]|uniref:Uncharacterized protein n=1 Tax=Hypsibius exemplaris TaxID=2072580 RepID=A0A1W0XF40_HYPEX|nr:hypothetical protein BV898_00220 [Hypsibius exemplaris]